MSQVICGVDANGRVYPLGVKYDERTGLASLAISRGAGKNTFTEEYAANQAATVIVSPAATQKVCVASVCCMGDGAAGEVSLNFAGSGLKVFRHYMTKYNQSSAQDMHIEGALDEDLTLTTTTAGDKVFIVVNYRLVS